jgi:hypothetical protein
LETSLGENPLILIASGIFTLVAGVWLTGHKEDGCFLCFKVILELFCCQEIEKRSLSNDEPRRKGNNRGKANTIRLSSQDYGEQIPDGLGWQTMLDPTVGPDVTINLGN